MVIVITINNNIIFNNNHKPLPKVQSTQKINSFMMIIVPIINSIIKAQLVQSEWNILKTKHQAQVIQQFNSLQTKV